INYNYLSNLNGSVANPALSSIGIHRETFGFEKKVADNASFGVRLPVFQQRGEGRLSEQDFGDVSLVFKYALINNCDAVLSTGVVLTLPTGPDFFTTAGNVHPTLTQPYVGYYYSGDTVFLLGFSSVVLPSDDRDAMLLFNDISVGMHLYED